MLKMMNVNVTLTGNNDKAEILKEISLTLENNKIYVITGPNGGGKSTIAKSIMGIIPINGGQIILDDTDITDKNITERAQLGIGYAFQTPARFKGLKVKEMLDLAAGENKVDNCQILYDVGLCAQDYLDREIDSTFSGGELKRIEIASILARKLKVAVFDEPEAGIDLWSFHRLTETFEKMHQKYDTTIVIISHQERILKLADEVILIEDGTVGKITSHEEFLKEIAHLDSDCNCRNDCIKGGTQGAECGR
ncbi:ABC transporter ATP-binding protein [Sinanaerobacter chloroacetimidivorans]|uniref:ATP-binding cassette domain-containing protein n=1 Tax=Sinanaerobacter chloroacetimidivorans TaxID=2818044 RepID=A0A8J7W170_9FIRM|nr:ATP-binding cassette domain-containing protein [Sinanaerobacter chloroacetimidivorans]MBR0598536.1 ATP-binding cassette domain-containing protein [Sinanaerobacter chloroacetimidivorans]